MFFFFFFQAEDGIRDFHVTGVQTCALPIYRHGLGAAVAMRIRPGHAHEPDVFGLETARERGGLPLLCVGPQPMPRDEGFRRRGAPWRATIARTRRLPRAPAPGPTSHRGETGQERGATQAPPGARRRQRSNFWLRTAWRARARRRLRRVG